MNTKYDTALEIVAESLKNEFRDELLGIILGGSVAYGTPLQHSDIDVFGVVRGSWHQRRAFVADDCDVELILRPVHAIRKDFKNNDMPATINIFANGCVIYDAGGILDPLIQEAKEILKQGPKAMSPKEQVKTRLGLVDLLKDTQDLLEVETQAAEYVMQETLREAIHAYYKIQRLWTVKSKYQLKDIVVHNSELYKMILNILSQENPISDRIDILSELVDKILEPIGGRLGQQWKSPIERLENS
ncbi:nucleotidyltransferase domain-containing protein [Scopulibacillus cellulosilyticus]|uniref:Nucleotidyltransferase domain-containing protein n=1 Tax=Scopulibacillus cellulosilyticus TaxID=2665665 RepID=A0ABW2PYP6_9BACL